MNDRLIDVKNHAEREEEEEEEEGASSSYIVYDVCI